MGVCECKKCHTKTDNNDKWRYTLYTTVIFLIVVNPATFLLVNGLLGSFIKICDSKGCPTMNGILVHAVVFTIILRYMMDLNI